MARETEADGLEHALISDGPVLLRQQGHIAVMTLNRPDSSNGLNTELLKALLAAVMRCHGDPTIRVVLLRGAGKNFCAGGDIHEFSAQGERLGDFLKEVTAYLQMAVGAMIRLDAIVVAEVQGFAAGGGGLGLVCAADLVVAADTAVFMTGATRVGMAPDGGSSVILPRLVGMRKAAELLYTNRPVPAAEAVEIGLINKAVPENELAAEARSLAEQLAAGAPLALSGTKRLLWNGVGVEQHLPEEARTVSTLSATSDSREGLDAVINRRQPVFSGK